MPGAATGGNSPQRVVQGRREAPPEGGRSFTPPIKTTANKAARASLEEPDSGMEGKYIEELGKAAMVIAKPSRKAKKTAKAATPEKAATHVGGGWYLMPDGSKVRGKAAAGLE